MGASTATQPAAASQPSQTQKRELTASQKIFLEDPEVRNEMLLEAFKGGQYKQCVDLCNLLSLEERKSLSGDARKAVAKAAMALDNPGQNRTDERENTMRGRDGRRANPSQHFPEQAEPEVAKPRQGTNPNGHLGEQQAPEAAKPRQGPRPGQTSEKDVMGRMKDDTPIYNPDALRRIHAAEMQEFRKEIGIDAARASAEAEIKQRKAEYETKYGKPSWLDKEEKKRARAAEYEKYRQEARGNNNLDELEALERSKRQEQAQETRMNEAERKAQDLKTRGEKVEDGFKIGGEVAERATDYIPVVGSIRRLLPRR